MSKKQVRCPKLLTQHPHCLQGLHVQSCVSDTGLARGVCAMHTVLLPGSKWHRGEVLTAVTKEGPAGGSLCLAVLPALAGTRGCSAGHRAATVPSTTSLPEETPRGLEIRCSILCL